MRSSPRVTKPAVIAACSCRARSQRRLATFALLPQVIDAVKVPVIAAGGIADGRGIAAAFALGASGAQIGTAYLFTPESTITDLHRSALRTARDDQTALTNIFTGRPARGLLNRAMREVGPMSDLAPAFPTAGGALAPLKAKAEAAGRGDFSALWSGQAASLGREMGAGQLTRIAGRRCPVPHESDRLVGLSQRTYLSGLMRSPGISS